ncbi:MAG: DUF1616 domain-containing protein [Chloroflexi bacterium]|nr:DUF1616 domain-containing protein [Chloroflexota bacterium]
MHPTFTLFRVLVTTGLVVLLPGYLLTYALFPLQVEFDGAQRFALSGGLGVILSIVIGTALIVLNIGLTPNSFLPTIGSITSVAVIVTWWRGGLGILRLGVQSAKLYSTIAFLLVLGVITAVFPSTRPLNNAEQYSEFYLIEQGANGLISRNENDVIMLKLSIVNNEQTKATYTIQVTHAGQTLHESEMISVVSESSWDGEIVIPFPEIENALTNPLEILLFREIDDEPYRRLTIWIGQDG